MPTKLVKGFVVGHGDHFVFADGSMQTRPKLIEYEALKDTVLVRVGAESLYLDQEAATAVRDTLSTLIEEMD